ncbi:hypothetical protein FGG08_000710 [Glutinoglossum americanum]|uniref:Uncharacterized protein n=1 Tax=Glutinoglossum americanum TaxID=1670608 RepID=A0A9P8IEZ3_9PEZI|nr:hypothetical protein FGG08_000710 [Glutinoglossum americanum]
MSEAEEAGKESATGNQLSSIPSIGTLLPSPFDNEQLPSPALSQMSRTSSWSSELYVEDGSLSKDNGSENERKVLKLSPDRIARLTSSPKSLPLHVAPLVTPSISIFEDVGLSGQRGTTKPNSKDGSEGRANAGRLVDGIVNLAEARVVEPRLLSSTTKDSQTTHNAFRSGFSARAVSTPPSIRRKNSTVRSNGAAHHYSSPKHGNRAQLQVDIPRHPAVHNPFPSSKPPPSPVPPPSPMLPSSIPLPPLSIPIYLQLELSSTKPSSLYIHHSATSDLLYESSKITFERILNFLILAPQLERVLWFGALACLDSWLYSFTILPLRFLKALGMLARWCGESLVNEIKEITKFIYLGVGRVWRRRRRKVASTASHSAPTLSDATRPQIGLNPKLQPNAGSSMLLAPENGNAVHSHPHPPADHPRPGGTAQGRKRSKSIPSALLPSHKADLLKGLVVIFSCYLLMWFDASRMYHSIRGQAAIKLYVIYNVLEVSDRLLAALGQDVFECLFSKETLERKPDGRSKILRPFGMLLLALSYNVIHAVALFYQVITLNVAVNSYSNALLALILSNQFVEIKSTVFKRFEKENLFQLTCADIVERFQLWLMLLIIASRNLIEVGTGVGSSGDSGASVTNGIPLTGGNILPRSFTIFPKWTGQVIGPFLLVLGSEMLVDWLKHAYITKFNNTSPAIYGRFLDVLAKDYYSHAFVDQNLTRRLGLPVIPLSCLFIRASLQTYHMFLETHVPLPIPSTATSLDESSTTSPTTTDALQHFDNILRRALGRSSFGIGSPSGSITALWNTDDVIALLTMLIFFLGLFLLLLGAKLVLGMLLLGFSRNRYRSMKEREREVVDTRGKRFGGFGMVDVNEEKRRWIYKDDPEGLRVLREREKAIREKEVRMEASFGGVSRYSMVAKRIW